MLRHVGYDLGRLVELDVEYVLIIHIVEAFQGFQLQSYAADVLAFQCVSQFLVPELRAEYRYSVKRSFALEFRLPASIRSIWY